MEKRWNSRNVRYLLTFLILWCLIIITVIMERLLNCDSRLNAYENYIVFQLDASHSLQHLRCCAVPSLIVDRNAVRTRDQWSSTMWLLLINFWNSSVYRPLESMRLARLWVMWRERETEKRLAHKLARWQKRVKTEKSMGFSATFEGVTKVLNDNRFFLSIIIP